MMTKRRGGDDLARVRGGRKPLPTLTIYCEAQNTEFFYLEQFKSEHRSKVKIVKIEKCEGQFGKMLDKATALAMSLRQGGGDQVWCVFDHDERSGIEIKYKEVIDAKVKVAFSNPCFELWALFHFRSSVGRLSSKQAQKELKKELPSFDHERSALLDYNALSPHYPKALSNAKNACACRKRDGDPLGNPYTDVYLLLEEIRKTGRTPENYLTHQGVS